MRVVSLEECSLVAGGDVIVETAAPDGSFSGFLTSVLSDITSAISTAPTIINAGLNELGIRG
jgi:hypothetical protein